MRGGEVTNKRAIGDRGERGKREGLGGKGREVDLKKTIMQMIYLIRVLVFVKSICKY